MVALLGGCNLAPPHVRPDLPTAADYPPSYDGDATLGQRAVEIGWRDFFSDPRLEQLVAIALVRNRDLAIAIAQIEEARGLYPIQAAERLRSAEHTSELPSRMRTSDAVFSFK